MRHSKPSPRYTGYYVHFYPTGLIDVSAERKTESVTRHIHVHLTEDVAREIQKTLNLADTLNIPLGHAHWHVENKVDTPCNFCKEITK